MVLGYFIATGIETGVELSFWLARKAASGIYYLVYGAGTERREVDIKELREELKELKDLLKKELETNE